LRKIIVEERGDLGPLILPLLSHPVRECTQNLLAILKLLVRFLERATAEEHLPSEEQRKQEHGDRPELNASLVEELRKNEPKES
jgi:hypothetical protein